MLSRELPSVSIRLTSPQFALAVSEDFDEWYFCTGLMTMIAFSILVLVSLRPIRSQAYEISYFTHFFMVL